MLFRSPSSCGGLDTAWAKLAGGGTGGSVTTVVAKAVVVLATMVVLVTATVEVVVAPAVLGVTVLEVAAVLPAHALRSAMQPARAINRSVCRRSIPAPSSARASSRVRVLTSPPLVQSRQPASTPGVNVVGSKKAMKSLVDRVR